MNLWERVWYDRERLKGWMVTMEYKKIFLSFQKTQSDKLTNEVFQDLLVYALGWFKDMDEKDAYIWIEENIEQYNNEMAYYVKCGYIDEYDMERLIYEMSF